MTSNEIREQSLRGMYSQLDSIKLESADVRQIRLLADLIEVVLGVMAQPEWQPALVNVYRERHEAKQKGATR